MEFHVIDTIVRIDAHAYATLRELAKIEQRPVERILADAVERYANDRFWREMEESMARLKADPVAWQEYLDEIALWDSTSGDGLKHEEPYDR